MVASGGGAVWRAGFWTLTVLGPVMSLLVFVTGYRVFFGTLEDDPANRVFDVAGVLLGVSMIVAMSGGFRGFASSQSGEGVGHRASRIGVWGMSGLMVGLGVFIILLNLGLVEAGEPIRTGLYSTPLLFCVASAYVGDRYTFFDLFIKRGLSLLLTILVLTTYLSVILPILNGFDFAWTEPWAYALVLLPVVAFALTSLNRRIGAWVDRVWLGRRFTTVEAVKQFLSSVQSATNERQLIDRAEDGISTIFRAPTSIDVTSGERSAHQFESKLDVPIPGGHGRVGVMRLGRRPNGAPFFSEDRSLLHSLGEVFASLLENVRLQEREQAQERRAKELSLQASRSDLKALRAQINPHFLFNALNAIAGLIHKDPGRADRTVEQLAEVFRYTLRRSEREWTPLEEEFEFVKAYLDVEQARFGQRLQCRVTLDDAVKSAVVPTMVVQTLVANAVKHGP